MIGLLIYICMGLIVVLKLYEAEQKWEGFMIFMFIFSPVVFLIFVIKQVFFTNWYK